MGLKPQGAIVLSFGLAYPFVAWRRKQFLVTRSRYGNGHFSFGAEVGYFAVRAAMSRQVAEASKYVLKHGVTDSAGPPLVKLLGIIGKRFRMVVSEKLAAQAIPVIGAVGGALINSYFIDHYQELARAQFTIRRLEREYGETPIREAFNGL